MARDIDQEDFADHLNELAAAFAGADYAPELTQCRDHLRGGFADNFSNAAAPDGTPWPARQDIGDGHPLLDDGGGMKEAAIGTGAGAIEELGPDELTLGISLEVIPYARAQDMGFPENNLPERHYLGASEDTIVLCGDELAIGVERIAEGV